jgi:hypothetical protein
MLDTKTESSDLDGLVVYDNGVYSVEIGLPSRTPVMGLIYKIVNKQWGMVEDELPHEPSAIQMADKLKAAKQRLGTVEYQASLIEPNRKH